MAAQFPHRSELPLWLQLNKVAKIYMDALASRLGHLGIRRYFFLLVAISEAKGSATQQQLADLMEVDKVAMVGILDSLARAGLIKRTPSRVDRRKHLIGLTPKAVKALPAIQATIRDLNQRAMSRLPGKLAGQFSAALMGMREELESFLAEEAVGIAPVAAAGKRRPKPRSRARPR